MRHDEPTGDEPPVWRPVLREDLAAIDAIGAQLHPLLTERPEIFAEKCRLFPEGCMALADAAGIAGYGICHPWMLNDIPPLDSFLVALPRDADCIFIHDVAVLPRARGRKAAHAYVEHVAKLAREIMAARQRRTRRRHQASRDRDQVAGLDAGRIAPGEAHAKRRLFGTKPFGLADPQDEARPPWRRRYISSIVPVNLSTCGRSRTSAARSAERRVAEGKPQAMAAAVRAAPNATGRRRSAIARMTAAAAISAA